MQELPEWWPLSEYHRRLVGINGHPVAIVSGDVIGAQYSCGEFTMLATSYDYFDGCHHWIYLLNRDGKPVDLLCMPDEFGFIQDMTVVSPNEVEFGFFGTNDRWNLIVEERGFWSYSFIALTRRLNRFIFAKRFLQVRRTKGTPWSLPTTPNTSSKRPPDGVD